MHRFAGAVFFLVVAILPFLLPYHTYAQFPAFSRDGLVPCGNNVYVTTDEKDQAGNTYLCIYDECTTCGLVTLAQNLIGFAIFLAVVVAALMFTYAGALYLFSSSNPGNISKAHGIFWDVLLGLVFVLAAWMVIDVIMKVLYGNGPQDWGPWNEVLCGDTSQRDCRVLETTRAGTVGAPSQPGPTPLPPGGKYPGDRGCPAPNSGPCALANMSIFGANAYKAAGICSQESSGGRRIRGDKCVLDGSYASWGIFQINISANPLPGLDCPKAFTARAGGKTCVPGPTGKCSGTYRCAVKDQELYRKCVAAASDPAVSIQKAYEMSNHGNNWNLWSTNQTCHF